MKKLKVFVVLLTVTLLAVCGSMVAFAAKTTPDAISNQTINVAQGKVATFTDYSGKTVNIAGWEGSTPSPALVTDGSFSPNLSTVKLIDGESPCLGWATVDLGKEYILDKLVVSFWHDWTFADAVIQLASNAEFTQGVCTVFNNNATGSIGVGKGTDTVWQNKIEAEKGTTLQLSPIKARYLRATNNAQGTRGYTLIAELQAYAFDETKNSVPVVCSKISGSYASDFDVALSTIYTGGKIYYTTDGSYPTAKSTLYTAPFNTSILGKNSFAIRAIVVTDTFTTLPSEYNYIIGEGFGTNVLAGVLPTISKLDGSAAQNKPFDDQGTGELAYVTDGAFNPSQTVILSDGTNAYQGWFMFDFGAEKLINKITASFWNDWGFSQVLIQVSTSADFTTGTRTIFNNCSVDLGGGIATDTSGWANDKVKGNTVTFSTASARYLRVTNLAGNSNVAYSGTVLCELQAFTPQADVVVKTDAIKTVSNLSDITVKNGQTVASIAQTLGKTLDIITVSGATATINGDWSCPTFSPDTAGDYTFVFNATDLDTNIVDAYGLLCAKVTVRAAIVYTNINSAITNANAKIEADYTPTSWTAFATALANAKTVKENLDATQAQVDEAAATLVTATTALLARANLTALNSKIEEVKNTVSTGYVTSGFATFTSALNAANTIKANLNATQEQVNAALTTLTNAFGNLQTLGSSAALSSKISEVEKMTQGSYSVETWAALEDALAAAKAAVLLPDNAQSFFDSKLAELNAAVTELVLEIDYTQFDSLITSCTAITATSYTKASFEKLTAAIKVAELARQTAITQTQITQATEALTAAKTALITKADFSALQAKYDEAKKLVKADYDANLFANLENAIKEAKVVLDNDESTAATISATLTKLQTAIQALSSAADKKGCGSVAFGGGLFGMICAVVLLATILKRRARQN